MSEAEIYRLFGRMTDTATRLLGVDSGEPACEQCRIVGRLAHAMAGTLLVALGKLPSSELTEFLQMMAREVSAQGLKSCQQMQSEIAERN